MHKSKLQLVAALVLGAIFMCLPAFYNFYPLWFLETGAYLEAAYNYELSPSSNAFYAGFLHYSAVLESLWSTIFTQGFLISLAIYYSFKCIYQPNQKWLFLFYTILASGATLVSYHSSHIMPDIFTPIMILAAGCLLFAPAISRQDSIVLSLLLVFSTSMHNAQWGIMGLLWAVWGGRLFLAKLKNQSVAAVGNIKGWGLVGGLTLLSYLLVSGIHYQLGGEFKPTRGEDFYFFDRLCDYSLVQQAIKREEIKVDHPINSGMWALYEGEEYLWGAGEHNLSGQGGWSPENEQFFEELNQEVLTTPSAYKRYWIKSIEQSFIQLFNVEMQPLGNVTADSIYHQSQRFRPTYGLLSYLARQRTEQYIQESISAKNLLQKACLLGSILILLTIYFLYPPSKYTRQQYFSLFIISGIIINAVIMVAFWGDNAHYQSRVAWMLTLPAFYEAYAYWNNHILKKKNTEEKLPET